jgi:hypothetical protein
VFTALLRRIIANQRDDDRTRHWIVFDGDVDPEWVESLNSVLDDNKLLTLPTGNGPPCMLAVWRCLTSSRRPAVAAAERAHCV